MRAPAAAAVLLLIAAAAHARCGDDLPSAHRLLTEPRPDADGWQIAFAPIPAPLTSGRHFVLDIVVCPPPGAAMPATLAVDADMPAHRHGMNYRASVTPQDGGRFRADGLMFHMAGRWRFIFDLPAVDSSPARRLTQEIDLR